MRQKKYPILKVRDLPSFPSLARERNKGIWVIGEMDQDGRIQLITRVIFWKRIVQGRNYELNPRPLLFAREGESSKYPETRGEGNRGNMVNGKKENGIIPTSKPE